MKQVAYNFEFACLGFIEHGAAADDVKLFFIGLASGVMLISFNDELDPAPKLDMQSFGAFNSSPLPTDITPKRFGIALKLATAFISSAIGSVIFCATNGSLFK